MIVYLLTEEQKKSLEGKCYNNGTFFNPVQDADDNWIITKEEIEMAEYKEILWVKDLPKIEYVKREIEDLHI